jgi:hypothetical protein
LEGLLRRFVEWLRDHAGSIEGISVKWIAHVVWVVLVLAGTVLIIWILRSSGPAGWRWRQPATKAIPRKGKATEVNWLPLRAEAEKKAQEGALRDAVRAFFVSVLMEGHGRGWWAYHPEATNMEHLKRFKGSEERRHALRHLIDLYEEAWYGLRQPGKEAFVNCKQWLRQMEAAP